MGQKVWQILPLGPTGYGNSPYQSLSSFAGNPLLISLDALVKDGMVTPSDLHMMPEFPDERVDFGSVIEVRMAFLKNAARHFINQCNASPLLARAFEVFCQRESDWLDDWAMFIALKEEHDSKPWTEWPREVALREDVAMAQVMSSLEAEIEEAKALQFLFHRQWNKLRIRARELGIASWATSPSSPRMTAPMSGPTASSSPWMRMAIPPSSRACRPTISARPVNAGATRSMTGPST